MRGDPITVLFRPSRSWIVPFPLYPIFLYPGRGGFRLTASARWVLEGDQSRHLVLVGWFKGRRLDAEARAFLDRLRAKYDTVAYVDTNAGTECQQAFLLPWVDLYFKRQVFRDRDLYRHTFTGNKIYSDFYQRRYGVSDPETPATLPPVADADLHKIRLWWSILVGAYPLRPWRGRTAQVLWTLGGVPAARLCLSRPRFERLPEPDLPVCHARFGFDGYRPTVGYQRRLFLDIAKSDRAFLAGHVPRRQYRAEMRRARGVLSPFGWGEVCYRDAETVLAGAVLFKPDMSHVETWPDLYRPDETYVPLAWDGSDVTAQVRRVLGDDRSREALRRQAWNALRSAYDALPARVDAVASAIRGARDGATRVARACP
jgi:hypothetical protein